MCTVVFLARTLTHAQLVHTQNCSALGSKEKSTTGGSSSLQRNDVEAHEKSMDVVLGQAGCWPAALRDKSGAAIWPTFDQVFPVARAPVAARTGFGTTMMV